MDRRMLLLLISWHIPNTFWSTRLVFAYVYAGWHRCLRRDHPISWKILSLEHSDIKIHCLHLPSKSIEYERRVTASSRYADDGFHQQLLQLWVNGLRKVKKNHVYSDYFQQQFSLFLINMLDITCIFGSCLFNLYKLTLTILHSREAYTTFWTLKNCLNLLEFIVRKRISSLQFSLWLNL